MNRPTHGSAAWDGVPPRLEGRFVRLLPLQLQDARALFEVGRDPSGWEYASRGALADESDARGFIASASAEANSIPFGIWDQRSAALVGTTRFFDMRPQHRGLEIGHTWLAPSARRSAINTEAKRLLLAWAFEVWGAYRVQLKTDLRNTKSQRAIERLGATREGILRRHMVVRDGFVRDTVMYSIIDAEWPQVRERLDQLLARA